MRVIPATVLFLMVCVSAQADQQAREALRGALVSAKFSGGCVILVQMARFQKDTLMPGGDEFLARFLNTESARLGMTYEQYLKQCTDAAKVYEHYYDITSPNSDEK